MINNEKKEFDIKILLKKVVEARRVKKILKEREPLGIRVDRFLRNHCEDIREFVDNFGFVKINHEDMRFLIGIAPEEKTDTRAISRAIRESPYCKDFDYEVHTKRFTWKKKRLQT